MNDQKNPWHEFIDARDNLKKEVLKEALKVIEPPCSVILNWLNDLIERAERWWRKQVKQHSRLTPAFFTININKYVCNLTIPMP